MLKLWDEEKYNMPNLIKMMITGYDGTNVKLHLNTHTHSCLCVLGPEVETCELR